jgi:predicted NBD/HSP70 family sugar kinase
MKTTTQAIPTGGNGAAQEAPSGTGLPAEGDRLPALDGPGGIATPARALKILVIDIGGTKLKVLATGQTEPRKAPSGRELTPTRLVEVVRALADGWDYEAVSIGYPGLAGDHGPRSEPGNLGAGWVGFDFAAAFDRPVKLINDAAMQALGSYEGGRMLFLGLGTGLGSALISENSIVPMELGRLWARRGPTLGDLLGRRGLKRLGVSAWRREVRGAASRLMEVFAADYVVLGGGNAKKLKDLPHGVRLGHNQTAFRGGIRLWVVEDVPIHAPSAGHSDVIIAPVAATWRLI